MGVDMFFSDLSEKRDKEKEYMANKIYEMGLPTIDELLEWAHSVCIHVKIEYQHNYSDNERYGWHIRIWDLPRDNSYILQNHDFNKICEFLHNKLKEL